MRRFDKKKKIQEANRLLEENFMFEQLLNEYAEPEPYQIQSDRGILGRTIRYTIQKEGDEIIMELQIFCITKNDSNRAHYDIINSLGLEMEQNGFSLYISFDRINSSTHYQSLRSYAGKIMATNAQAVRDFIETMYSDGYILETIFSQPVGGDTRRTRDSGENMREGLYNLFYRMEIKNNSKLSGFDFFKYSHYSGIYNEPLKKQQEIKRQELERERELARQELERMNQKKDFEIKIGRNSRYAFDIPKLYIFLNSKYNVKLIANSIIKFDGVKKDDVDEILSSISNMGLNLKNGVDDVTITFDNQPYNN